MSRPKTRFGAALLLVALGSPGAISACGDDGTSSFGRTPPPPATTGASSTGGSSTGPVVDPTVVCAELADTTGGPGSGQECYCAADYAVGDPRPSTYTCRDACIPSGAIGTWCFDTLACCPGSTCIEGLCIGPSSTTGDSSSGSDSGSSGSSGSTGSSGGSDSSSDSGSSSGGSSSSDSGTTDGSGSGSSSTTAG